MSRIRTIKPGFHAHEELSTLPPETHLLAAALINYADDEGYFNANIALVRAGTNPLRYDPTPITIQLQQLVKIGYIEIRIRGNRQLGRVVNFLTHQRVSHAAKSTIRKGFEELPEPARETPEPLFPELNRIELKGIEGNTTAPTREEPKPEPIQVTPVVTPPTPPTPPVPTPAAKPIEPLANPEVSTLVRRIILAHPRSLSRQTQWNEVSPSQECVVLQAMSDEVKAFAMSPMEALQGILAGVEHQARDVPLDQHRFFKEIPDYFRLHEYRRDPSEFTGGKNNGARSKGGSTMEALSRSLSEAGRDQIGLGQDGRPARSQGGGDRIRNLLLGPDGVRTA